MKFEERYIFDFLRHLEQLGYADNTICGYRRDLEAFAGYCSKTDLDSLMSAVEAFVERTDALGKAPAAAYRNRRLSCLRSFFRYLEERKLLDAHLNPTVHLRFARLNERQPSFLSHAEYVKIIQAIRRTNSGWIKHRDLAIAATLYNTGLRLSELISLNVGQFDKDGARFIGLRRKGGETKDLPVNRNVIWALGAWLKVHPMQPIDADSPLFVSRLQRRMSGRTVEQLITSYASKAGINKSVTPHTFRHSHCTEIQRRGAQLRTAQAIMGHRSIETTMRYSHSEESDIRAAIARLDEPEMWAEEKTGLARKRA